MNVADALQTKYYEDGEAIIKQVSRLSLYSPHWVSVHPCV